MTFEDSYYSSNQGTSVPLILSQRRANSSTGRKKLKQVESEIQRLTTVRHQNLISVFAVKLNIPHSHGPPQLMVLSEQSPALTLHDVLQDCDSLREERASDYLGQILSGLNAVHGADLVHRGTEVLVLGFGARSRSVGRYQRGVYQSCVEAHSFVFLVWISCCVGYGENGPSTPSSKPEIRSTQGFTQVCPTPHSTLHL